MTVNRSIPYAAAFLVFGNPALSSGCDGILNLTRNVDYEQKSILIAQDIYSEHCEGSSVNEKSSFDAGLDFLIEQVPVGLKLGSGNTKQKIQHLCSKYAEWYNLNNSSVSLAISTSDNAIDAWRFCKELEEEEVFFSVNPNRELVGFGVRRGSDIIDFLGMEYKPEDISCFGPFGENGTQVIIDGETRFTLTSAKEQPITCRRNFATTEDGIEYLPSTEVAIMAEGRPPLIIPLPRDEIYEPAYSSEIKSSLDTMKTELNNLRSEQQSSQAALRGNISDVNNRLSSFSEKISVKTQLFMRGEHGQHGEPFFKHIGCKSHTDHAKNFCGGSPYHMEQIFQRSGNKCGYTYLVVTCTTK